MIAMIFEISVKIVKTFIYYIPINKVNIKCDKDDCLNLDKVCEDLHLSNADISIIFVIIFL